ncbi:hypothetical protein CONLIGDRAFT_102421 [Coniochaeta ligniaria NRRL 30616]|uniref:Cell wall protein n=1 Tax=Coniochaeta ligniaria NRRL 30616 TaxID=1408157 RepID=A0A1J7IB36_9PEZI|nr:hypothetical protein CONLIGDRAFT_102421 [Coniochaeta ligniaria NRRL 30616]
MQLYKPITRYLLLALLPALPALARTDLEGCVSTEVIIEKYYASYIWYVPDTGEICSFLDCGGGRAPPKTTQPGCGGYEGTETVTPSYLPGFGATAGTITTAAPTILTSQSQADSTVETSSSDTDVASPTASEDSTITEAPAVSVSGGTVITTGTSTQSSTTTSSTGSAPGTASSSSSSSSASSSGVSTGGASSQTGASKNMVGVVAAVVGGLAFL